MIPVSYTHLIPVLDENGVQKVGARNRKQWKRVLTDATGWNSPKNCELWRSEWSKMCNRHLSVDNQIDHRSYERQGKLKVPTIHEGADARKIEKKYLTGQIRKGSWKVEENQMIKKQNEMCIRDRHKAVSDLIPDDAVLLCCLSACVVLYLSC